DQGRIWAATAVSQKELQLRQQMDQRVNSLDPTASDYPAKIASLTDDTNAEVQQAASDLQDQAPSKSARKFASLHMSSAGVRLTAQSMATQSQLNAQYTTGLVQAGVKADSDLLAAQPDNDTYQRLLSKQQEAITGLTTISPDVKQKLLNDVSHQYAQVQ